MNWAKFGTGFALLFCISACSSSPVLVQPDDSAFNDAQRRLLETKKLVDRENVSPAEQTLFMQAEGFFRYRFLPPSRGGKPFLAEAAAAITDFPAFQSLAGSFDLFDLRIRAPDAAVQLWETFLARYPNSNLKPLTLYRLGWAYRSVGVSGFPRDNPDDAFKELRSENPNSKLAVYARDASDVPWKSKSTAATRSLIPGLGQFYADDNRSGAIRLAVALVAAAAVAYPAYLGIKNGGISFPMAALGVGGLVVLSFDYTSSYEDAQRGVVQWNELVESHFYETHPESP